MAIRHITNDFSCFAPGGAPAPTTSFDGNKANQDFQDVCDIDGAQRIRGTKCTEKNSNAATCEIWLANDGGAKDVAEAGDKVIIYYNNGGTATYWKTTIQVSGSDCYISFGNAQMYDPTAALSVIADYSAAGLRNGLTIRVFPGGDTLKISYDMIMLTDGAAGALQADNIINPTTGNDIATDVNDLKTRVDVALDGAGALNSGIVTATSLDIDEVNAANSCVNLLEAGNLQQEGTDEKHLYGVEDTGGITPFLERVVVDGWTVSQGGIAAGSNEGFLFPLDDQYDQDAFKGKAVTVQYRVRVTVANKIEIGTYDDDASFQMTTQTISANTWTDVTVTKTIGASATEVKGAIRATAACTFYVLKPQLNVGDVSYAFSCSPYFAAKDIAMSYHADNLLFNGGFENWTLSTQPDGWHMVGTPTLGAGTSFFEGAYDCEITCDQDEGLRQYLGIVTNQGAGAVPAVNEGRIINYLQGRYVNLAVSMVRIAGADPIRISIHSHNGAVETETYKDIIPGVVYNRYSISHLIQSDALYVWVEIVNRTGASVGQQVAIDAAMVNVGTFPLLYHESWGWRGTPYHFFSAVALTVASLNAQGVPAGRYPMYLGVTGQAQLILKAAVYAITAPAGGNNTLRALPDGSNGVTVTLLAGSNNAVGHVTDYTDTNHICSVYLAADVSAIGGGANEADDVILTLWAYEYNPV